MCVGLVGIRIEMYSYGLYGMCVTGTAGPAAPVDVMPQLLYARWPPLSTKGGQFELRRRTFGQDTHDSSSWPVYREGPSPLYVKIIRNRRRMDDATSGRNENRTRALSKRRMRQYYFRMGKRNIRESCSLLESSPFLFFFFIVDKIQREIWEWV